MVTLRWGDHSALRRAWLCICSEFDDCVCIRRDIQSWIATTVFLLEFLIPEFNVWPETLTVSQWPGWTDSPIG